MSNGWNPSFRANESIPAYVVVAVNASSAQRTLLCEIADTSTSMPIGIIQDAVSTNGAANIITCGVARGLCAASVSAGALVGWQTATGQIVEVGAATITSKAIGFALYPGSTNAVIEIMVAPQLIPNA